MSQSGIYNVIKAIPDSQNARVSIVTEADGAQHFDCIYREGTAPRFFLLFPLKNLPKDINVSQHCSLSVNNSDDAKPPISFTAKIEEIIGKGTLELTALNVIDPTRLRQYFRVPITVPVFISFQKQSGDSTEKRISMNGETLDMSGSGLLAIFEQECPVAQQIDIGLNLSSPSGSVSCVGHVVHTRRVRRGRWHVAVHFDQITNKQRDIIISNCLEEQRRQLKQGLQPVL